MAEFCKHCFRNNCVCGDERPEPYRPQGLQRTPVEISIGPQKQPASLARLKAEVQQVLATINELQSPQEPNP